LLQPSVSVLAGWGGKNENVLSFKIYPQVTRYRVTGNIVFRKPPNGVKQASKELGLKLNMDRNKYEIKIENKVINTT
jgi:hypothetical protein